MDPRFRADQAEVTITARGLLELLDKGMQAELVVSQVAAEPLILAVPAVVQRRQEHQQQVAQSRMGATDCSQAYRVRQRTTPEVALVPR